MFLVTSVIERTEVARTSGSPLKVRAFQTSTRFPQTCFTEFQFYGSCLLTHCSNWTKMRAVLEFPLRPLVLGFYRFSGGLGWTCSAVANPHAETPGEPPKYHIAGNKRLTNLPVMLRLKLLSVVCSRGSLLTCT